MISGVDVKEKPEEMKDCGRDIYPPCLFQFIQFHHVRRHRVGSINLFLSGNKASRAQRERGKYIFKFFRTKLQCREYLQLYLY